MFTPSPTFIATLTVTILPALSAFGQNNKPIRSGTYYEDRANATGTDALTLSFSQSPADKFLNITRVACRLVIPRAQLLNKVVLNVGTSVGQDDTGRTQFLAFKNIQTFSADYYYPTIDEPLYLKIGPGRYPSLRFVAPQFPGGGSGQPQTTADCSLVGDLTDN